MNTARAERATLQLRLERGWQVLAAAETAGKDITALEEYWWQLLAEYEATFERGDISRQDESEGVMPIQTTCRECGGLFEPDALAIRHGLWQVCPACQSAAPQTRCAECGRILMGTNRTLCLRCHGAAA